MLTGVYAARNIVGEKHDVWSVNTEKAYHEEGQVAHEVNGHRLVPSRVTPPKTETQMLPDAVIQAAFARLDTLALGIAMGTISGVGLFLATAVLLLHRDAAVVGPHLSLLGHYLWGFQATWTGALTGLIEAGVGGFLSGCLSASLRNWSITAYTLLVQRRAAAKAQRYLLDQV